ncbi:MAG: prolyl oligopeptidase family serine peptidase [Myxococcota bacterium]
MRTQGSRPKARVLAGVVVSVAVGCGPNKNTEPPDPPPAVDRSSAARASADATPTDGDPTGFVYPSTERVDVVDDYHGQAVADPYRWLEDLDSAKTRAWVEAQNALTFGYLGQISERDAIRARMTTLWNYERWGLPSREGSRYVVSRNDGLQNQSVIYTLDRLDGPPEVLLDPNALSPDGTVALAGMKVSPDGAWLAYGTSASGSDWQTWHVRDMATTQDSTDRIDWIKFTGVTWTKDSRGFYYAGYDAPEQGEELAGVNYDQKVYFHRLGTPKRDDVLVYARPDHKEWSFTPEVTEDGKYLVLTVRIGTDRRKSVFVQRLGRSVGKGPIRPVVSDFPASYAFIANDGPIFYFRTDDQAPRGRVVAIDVRKPPGRNQRELIAQAPYTLRGASLVGDTFILRYLEDAHARVELFDRRGRSQGAVALPGLGAVEGFSGRRRDSETFYAYSSFATPRTIMRFDPQKGRSEVFRAPKVAFSPEDYVTEQVFFESRDGTRVPMFLSHHRDVTPSPDTPTYLYGYGGFNIAITPRFSVPDLVWMEMGGLYAVANLRGGGEYGEAWHAAGTKRHKQNVFDDFIGAAQWLVDQGKTSPSKLAIGGRSNGGLLVGAAITQRPDLFGAALPGVGVMDMLRFNRFTIGWAWESDYGSPQDPAHFEALRAYSPYHNLRSGTAYPPTLVYTADHDDRVVPGHSYKFTAALQHAHAGDAPVMIRVDTKSGHGAGKPTAKRIEEWTDLWGFLVANLKMTPRRAG